MIKPYIYIVTDLRNNMKVVGKCSNQSKAYFTGSIIVNQIIKKNGRKEAKSFLEREVVIQGDFNQTLLNELEKHYIRLYNTKTPHGYNLTDGGDGQIGGGGWKHTEAWKKANSIRNKGKKPANEKLRQEGLRKAWADPERRKKMTQVIIDRCNTPEHKNRTSRVHKGKTLSLETIEKVKSTWFKKGEVSPNKGVLKTEDQKQKLRKVWSERYEWRRERQNTSGLVARQPVPAVQYTISGEFVKSWDSIQIAERALGISGSSISRVIRGAGLKTAGGFVWKRKIEENAPIR